VVRLIINGNEHTVDEPSGRTLLDVLREDLHLTGAKYGCGEGRCGACTVLLDGIAVRACMEDLEMIDGAAVSTVEGLAREGHLHAVQAAFVQARSLQCGYCTPGMVMSVVSLIERDGMPSDEVIHQGLAGNICRCGGYPRIVQAVHAAAAMQGGLGRGAATEQIPAAQGAPLVDGAQVWTVVLSPADGDPRAERDWGWTTLGGARLSIDNHGRITAFTGKVDGGQGNRVALTRVIAAELATSTSMVHLVMGDTACVPLDLGTFGSRSLPDAGHGLRLIAAAARGELLREAARRWQCGPDDLLLVNGAVCERGGDHQIAYGALVGGGSRTILVDPDDPLSPAPPGLADVDSSSLREALIAATTGAKQFPSDLQVPNMLHARVLRPPGYGARLSTVDTTAARRMPGVNVVQDGDFVAVCAPTRAAADMAVDALQARWERTAQPAEADLESYLRSHPAESTGWEGPVDRDIGDVDKVAGQTDVGISATYTSAYIAHVPMEPRAALAQFTGDTMTVWVGTQRPFGVRGEVAAALGVAEEQVRIVVPDFGGGFGGKHTGRVAVEAARLAQATGAPIKVCWTREEEFRWAYFRPAAVIDVRSTTTHDGNLMSWEFTNINSGAAGLFSPYNVPNLRERFQPAKSPLPQDCVPWSGVTPGP
jgi:aerobic-type carbon monoxide dehydrogenase small subunit (CoxS/CutS family)